MTNQAIIVINRLAEAPRAPPAIVDAHRGDPQALIDWHQRFPASKSHERHDVAEVGGVFEEKQAI